MSQEISYGFKAVCLQASVGAACGAFVGAFARLPEVAMIAAIDSISHTTPRLADNPYIYWGFVGIGAIGGAGSVLYHERREILASFRSWQSRRNSR